MEPSPLAGHEVTEGVVTEGVVSGAEAVSEVEDVEGAPVEVDLDAVAVDLDAVDHALLRLDSGSYGMCEVCEAALPDDTLSTDPVARRCREHQVGSR